MLFELARLGVAMGYREKQLRSRRAQEVKLLAQGGRYGHESGVSAVSAELTRGANKRKSKIFEAKLI